MSSDSVESRGGDPATASVSPTALSGKVALVTGASRGIGRGIALGLGEAGATVYVTGRSADLSATCRAFDRLPGKCVAVQCDHASREQVEQLFARIARENDAQLDILVNNAYAAVSALTESAAQSFWDKPPDMFERVNRVGLQSHYEAAVLAARRMVRRSDDAAQQRRSGAGGLIVNISSWGSLAPLFDVAYGVGKHAIDRMTADMGRELRPHNVHVVSLWPGLVATDALTRFARESGFAPIDRNDPTTLYNAETTLFQGRAVACIATAPSRLRRSMAGRIVVSAELAQRFGFVDEHRRQPRSFRSLGFALGSKVPRARGYLSRLPRWCDAYAPWSVVKALALASPQFW